MDTTLVKVGHREEEMLGRGEAGEGRAAAAAAAEGGFSFGCGIVCRKDEHL